MFYSTSSYICYEIFNVIATKHAIFKVSAKVYIFKYVPQGCPLQASPEGNAAQGSVSQEGADHQGQQDHHEEKRLQDMQPTDSRNSVLLEELSREYLGNGTAAGPFNEEISAAERIPDTHSQYPTASQVLCFLTLQQIYKGHFLW